MWQRQLMHKDQKIYQSHNIEFRIVYSRRRTLGISVLPDSSVIVRAPYRTSLRTISMIVQEKAAWIIKHRDSYRQKENRKLNSSFVTGDKQLFRGKECMIQVVQSKKPFVFFDEKTIVVGLDKPEDTQAIRRILYKGYKTEGAKIFSEMLGTALRIHENQMFKPTGLIIRSMKSRWGSCSRKGIITLSTELIKLPDIFIEYVIIHELCHLKHHNHGKEYYELLSELFHDWKKVRKELREYIH
jgi:predicted metal-dependent hydrolase